MISNMILLYYFSAPPYAPYVYIINLDYIMILSFSAPPYVYMYRLTHGFRARLQIYIYIYIFVLFIRFQENLWYALHNYYICLRLINLDQACT